MDNLVLAEERCASAFQHFPPGFSKRRYDACFKQISDTTPIAQFVLPSG